MAKFETSPTVTWVGGKKPWITNGGIEYQSDVLDETIVVPGSFLTDFDSTPRIPGLYWLVGGKATLPAIVHDYLYSGQHISTRKEADQVFLEAMTVIKDPKCILVRWIMYLGVRIGGKRTWKKNNKTQFDI
jgi:hypothetical protein